MKNFIEELKWRGMLAQMMPGTEELLQKCSVVVIVPLFSWVALLV